MFLYIQRGTPWRCRPYSDTAAAAVCAADHLDWIGAAAEEAEREAEAASEAARMRALEMWPLGGLASVLL